MTLFSTVYKPNDGDPDAGGGDTEARSGGSSAAAPTATSVFVGTVAKESVKASYMSRYWMDEPYSGTAFPAGVGADEATILKAKVSFEVSTTAVLDGASAEIRFGLLKRQFEAWVFQNLTFSAATYSLKRSYPYVTSYLDVIQALTLESDVFLTSTAPMTYTDVDFAAGSTIEIGEGFSGLEFTLTDFVSTLNSYFPLVDPAVPILGLTIDPNDGPKDGTTSEGFSLWTHDAEPLNSGLMLTLEWCDSQTSIQSRGITVGPAVASSGLDVSGSVDSRGLSSESAVDASLIVEDEES
jgi:hypothetical protein